MPQDLDFADAHDALQVFKQLGADIRVKRMYFLYQIYVRSSTTVLESR